MRLHTRIGIAGTGAWVLLFSFWIYRDWPAVLEMKLNELGDSLAGAAAPVALLWLVLGYIQHGRELSLNTKALRAQEQELRRQVEQTGVLADNAARQAQATEQLSQQNREQREEERQRQIRLSQPVFIPDGGGSSGNNMEVRLKNRGAPISNIGAGIESSIYSISVSPTHYMDFDDRITVKFVEKPGAAATFPIVFTLDYTDGLKERRSKTFQVSPDLRLEERHRDEQDA